MRNATASNVSVNRDRDLQAVFQTFSNVRLARIGLTDALRNCDQYLIQRLDAIYGERDPETGETTPSIGSNDFKPVTLSLDDSIDHLYSFEPPFDRATNSLPRHSGFILVKPQEMTRIAPLAAKLNASKQEFHAAANEFAKRHIVREGTTFNQKAWYPTQTLMREGVFERENYEMVTRPCYFIEDPVSGFRISWNTNNYSQPKKLSKLDFINLLESEEIAEFGYHQQEAIRLAKKLPDGAHLAKRFYLPPYPVAQARFDDAESSSWGKNIYLSSPVIITGADLNVEQLKEKATLPGLDVSYNAGVYRVLRKGGRPLKPLPDLLHPHLKWYIV